MSQNDFNLANQGFPQMRTDMNSAFQALASNSSGATAPGTTYAYQFWYDTSTNLLKMRNADNDAWITLAAFDQSADEWQIRSSVIQAADSAGVEIKTDEGTTRITVADDGTVTLANDLVVTGTVQASNISATGSMAARNKIINGAMTIDQRNAGAAVTVNNTNANYGVDRWWGTGRSADGVYTLQRSTTTPPSGFTHFLRATVTTADASIASGDTYYIATKIEGFNVSDLGFGSANAKTITISFAVRSSVTGTFSGALLNGAENRSYPFTFAVSSANTWETKSVTIAGDTTGTWATDNSAGMVLCFDLGNGSNFRAAAGSWDGSGKYGVTGAVTLISTLNATFDITGVQLEAGDTATPFEHRSFGQELALCQRYYQLWSAAWTGVAASSAYVYSASIVFHTEMRATPTLGVVSQTSSARYPSSSYSNAHITKNGALASYVAQSAGGNETWTVNGTARSEL